MGSASPCWAAAIMMLRWLIGCAVQLHAAYCGACAEVWAVCQCAWCAQACVVGSTLWLFGGTVEIGDKEITLDECVGPWF